MNKFCLIVFLTIDITISFFRQKLDDVFFTLTDTELYNFLYEEKVRENFYKIFGKIYSKHCLKGLESSAKLERCS